MLGRFGDELGTMRVSVGCHLDVVPEDLTVGEIRGHVEGYVDVCY